MKLCCILPVILGLFAVSLPAQTPAVKEFELLQSQRDKAMTDAVKPINDRYVKLLEELLNKTTRAGDEEAVAKIKAELDKELGRLTAETALGTWNGTDPSGRSFSFILLPEGKVVFINADGRLFSNVWTLVEGELTIRSEDERFVTTYKMDGKELKGFDQRNERWYIATKAN